MLRRDLVEFDENTATLLPAVVRIRVARRLTRRRGVAVVVPSRALFYPLDQLSATAHTNTVPLLPPAASSAPSAENASAVTWSESVASSASRVIETPCQTATLPSANPAAAKCPSKTSRRRSQS